MQIVKDIILPLFIAVFASTGFWSWLSQRKASNKAILTAVQTLDSRVQGVEEQVDQLKQDNALIRAESARVRLLRFNGELLRDVKHTHEEFLQALGDIDVYEAYCKDHPRYPNSRAVLAIENIRRCYDKCSQQHDFL